MDLSLLGKEPISAENPTGSDVRYEQEFDELQAEIDKLSSPSASGGVDWEKVSTISSKILAQKSKDLLIASYMAVAQIHIAKIEGLEIGLRVIHDLLEQFWDNLFPEKKRMRGRVAAIEWWLEKSEAALHLIEQEPLSAEKIEEYRKCLQDIDALLQGYLSEAPLLRPLERFLDTVPIKDEKKLESETLAPSTDRAEAPSPPKTVTDTGKPSRPPKMEQIASASDAERILRDALQTVRLVANHLQKEDLSNPQGYRWRRMAGWCMIQALPPETDGRTQIPPPLNHDTFRNHLAGQRDKGNWEALVRETEEKFQGALLWLDLNRFIAETLTGLGDKYQEAHDAVCRETAYLVYRIPGIESLSFSDGTPFCDTETRQWLKDIGMEKGTAMAQPVFPSCDQETDHMVETMQKANALVKKKKVGEAVSILQQELWRSFSKREQLLWRLELSQILMNDKKAQLALPHLEAVLHDIDTFKLEEWEPILALKGLKMIWLGFSTRSDEAGKERASEVFKRIAKLDATEALLVTQR